MDAIGARDVIPFVLRFTIPLMVRFRLSLFFFSLTKCMGNNTIRGCDDHGFLPCYDVLYIGSLSVVAIVYEN